MTHAFTPDYSGQLSVIPGTMPLRSDLQQAKNALEEQPAELVQVSLSPQQQYLLLLVHQAAESAVLEVLRPFGFAAASFGTLTGTVQENLQRLDDEEEQTRQDRRAEEGGVLGERPVEGEVVGAGRRRPGRPPGCAGRRT